MTTPIQTCIIFAAGILTLLAFDLFAFHRKPHEIKLREALLASAGWILIALLFGVWVYFDRGPVAGVDFFTAYLVEKSLSVDNILVFIIIFDSFGVPTRSQHRVLYYGVVGALILRAIFVLGGVALLQHFHAIVYVFGAFLLFTGARLVFRKPKAIEREPSFAIRIVRKFFPVTEDVRASRLFVRRSGKWLATPLLLALLAVEISDVLFAVDSVPAVLAITQDTFIAYTSNIFAILGLRSLY